MPGRVLSFPVVFPARPKGAGVAPGRGQGFGSDPMSRTDSDAPQPPSSPEEAERFRRLFLPHLNDAYGFARFLCRNPTTAEDIVQEAYLRAFRSFSSYQGGDPKAWLFSIVRSSLLSLARRDRAWTNANAREAQERSGEESFETPSAEDGLIRSADVEELRRAVEDLPDPFRETLVLRELQELSYREIAELTGVPMGTVMSRLARARGLLTSALRGAGDAR